MEACWLVKARNGDTFEARPTGEEKELRAIRYGEKNDTTAFHTGRY